MLALHALDFRPFQRLSTEEVIHAYIEDARVQALDLTGQAIPVFHEHYISLVPSNQRGAQQQQHTEEHCSALFHSLLCSRDTLILQDTDYYTTILRLPFSGLVAADLVALT